MNLSLFDKSAVYRIDIKTTIQTKVTPPRMTPVISNIRASCRFFCIPS